MFAFKRICKISGYMNGYLFDVDGTITDRPGHVDQRVIDRSRRIQDSGEKVAYITGRPAWWLHEKVVPAVGPDIPLFGEYVNVLIHNGKTSVDPRSEEFHRVYRPQLKERIADVSRFYGVPVIMEDRRTYPDGIELWFEEHLGILATWINPRNPKTDKYFIYKVVTEGFNASGFPTEEFAINFAFNCSPVSFADNNKRSAATKALSLLDPEGVIERWYAFGDSAMDEEMTLADPKRITFVSVAGTSSQGVIDFLDSL